MKNWYWTDTVTIYPAWDRLRECRCPGSTINNSLSRSVSYFSMVTSHVQTWALDIFFPLKGALSSTHFSKWHYNSIQFFKNGARLWVSPLKYVPSAHFSPLPPPSPSQRHLWPVFPKVLTCVPALALATPMPTSGPTTVHSPKSSQSDGLKRRIEACSPAPWDPFNCFPWDLVASTSLLTSAPSAPSATLLHPSLI